MGNIFYIADWHYGHANALNFDARPYKNVEEMNEALITNWNSVVSPGDTVYVLGDMFWCKTTEAITVLDRLNGQKILVQGNHDRVYDAQFRSKFVKIDEYMEIKDGDRNVVLCHYPIPCFKNHFYGWYMLHGHVHTSFEANMMEHDRYLMEELYGKPCNMYNCGAMCTHINYTPRTLDEIINTYTKKE